MSGVKSTFIFSLLTEVAANEFFKHRRTAGRRHAEVGPDFRADPFVLPAPGASCVLWQDVEI
jgi:hypothetical protein